MTELLCKIHPVVIFSILDHYVRRNEEHRAIGTLIGTIHDGVAEIKSCFPVLHTEGEVVGVDMDVHKNFFRLHQQVAPREVILGWYATGSEINENSVMINDFYWKEKYQNFAPIHITVDTNLSNLKLNINAYTSVNVTINDKAVGTQFLPLPFEVKTLEAEQVGLDLLVRDSVGKPNQPVVSNLETLESSIAQLHELVLSVSGYVSEVLDQKRTPNTEIGRFLADAISALPKIEPSHLENLFTNSLQDLLLVVYLANLTRTQLRIAEKLQKSI